MKRVVGVLVVAACVAACGCGERAGSANEAREKALRAHHDQCVKLFVKTEGNGGDRMVVFAHSSPNYPPSLLLPDADPTQATGTWVMDRVQLVGLLNAERPRVYTTATRMGAKGPVRDLDGFESYGLSRLLDGKEVHVSEAAGEVRMLGAIRMGQGCVACHDKPQGTLLGAFSYSFKPAAQ